MTKSVSGARPRQREGADCANRRPLIVPSLTVQTAARLVAAAENHPKSAEWDDIAANWRSAVEADPIEAAAGHRRPQWAPEAENLLRSAEFELSMPAKAEEVQLSVAQPAE